MTNDLQKAGLWKRTAAWMFDSILTVILAVGLGTLLSALLGYDALSGRVDEAYARYEAQYGVVFEISQEAFEAMDDAQRENYNAAYEALIADEQAMADYNLMLNMTLVIICLGILFAVLILELAVPLYFGNGQTLGKKIFALAVMRVDSVRMNNLQLFARTILGRYTIDIMIPVYGALMLFWGALSLPVTLLLLGLFLAQVLTPLLNRSGCCLHDLLAGTVVVDMGSQMIFRSTEDLIAYQKKRAAERAARQPY